MDAEIETVERNDAWELIDFPEEFETIGVKWIFKTKLKENGEVDNYKARLVVQGYKQEYGVNYIKVFAQLARYDTIRLVDCIGGVEFWACLPTRCEIGIFARKFGERAIFVEQPPNDYIKISNKHKVYKLKNALYGLKQVSRAWYNRIEAYFMISNFQKCYYDATRKKKLATDFQ